jgi:predicted nucleotidyltransferase
LKYREEAPYWRQFATTNKGRRRKEAEGYSSLASELFSVDEGMLEDLRPECNRSDLLNSIVEIGQGYLGADTKPQLRRGIDDIDPLLVYDSADERVLREFSKLRSVVADLKGVRRINRLTYRLVHYAEAVSRPRFLDLEVSWVQSSSLITMAYS